MTVTLLVRLGQYGLDFILCEGFSIHGNAGNRIALVCFKFNIQCIRVTVGIFCTLSNISILSPGYKVIFRPDRSNRYIMILFAVHFHPAVQHSLIQSFSCQMYAIHRDSGYPVSLLGRKIHPDKRICVVSILFALVNGRVCIGSRGKRILFGHPFGSEDIGNRIYIYILPNITHKQTVTLLIYLTAGLIHICLSQFPSNKIKMILFQVP